MRKYAFSARTLPQRPPVVDSRDVWIDVPQEGETITGPRYAIQVDTIPAAICVDIRIDGGPWLPCRESFGLWLYDWSGYSSGEHVIMARILKDGVGLVLSEPRVFTVRLA